MVFHTKNPHFVLFPLMAQGHIIPMMDIARLLAQRGIIITIFTTPKNASRFNSVLSRAVSSGLQIRIVQLHFPSKEAGLPEGCENVDMVTSEDMYKIFYAINMLQKQAEELFEALTPKPSCIISDFCIHWTTQVAQRYHIPRISFHGFSCFALHCLHQINSSKVCENITSESEYFTIPGIPDQIRLTKEQTPLMNSNSDKMNDFREQIRDAEMKSYGVIINTFEELEKAYVRDYKKVKNDKVCCIGPVSLCNKDGLDKAQRGNQASINEHHCFKWLDLHQPKSVLYVCFGSLCNLIPSQLVELALALEDTKRPFVWVIREGSKFQELEKWIMEEGFEERTKGRGLIIRGWAPQVLILSHPAIGGFLTHCGWNSTLEGISAGVPLITWPLFGDQFLNEKLITQVLKIGVSVGVEIPMKWGEEEKVGLQVKKEDIKKTICMVMDDDNEESRERRERAGKLSEMAKRAVEKDGSSHLDMTLLIQDIMQQSCNGEEDMKLTPKDS
ncbi:UDP-glycosyltransferase 73C2 [Cajanus cajan]|uniref:Glycosyltransferase n=1 Tax=Cajanus cajan TaxID=3821 RepID=A0A151TVF4_CAJCA|nr:UDP-glycosyltransferase 73C2 [Cajanus cajan]KYP70998.1 Cytokinin-O-glucosyltransferase 1 [Cajanus cajan]